MTKKTVAVLGMGGTIAGQASSAGDNIDYKAAELGIESLLQTIPIDRRLEFDIYAEQVAQLDSKDMSLPALHQLAQRVNAMVVTPCVKGIVITHGTDTLEETAFFLQQVCSPSKPVVLTCAMRPATAFVPDGPQNILDALVVACCPDVAGVFVVCAGRIHLASLVQKIHTYRLDSFSSGEAGCFGLVEEGCARFLSSPPAVPVVSLESDTKKILLSMSDIVWPRVEILMNFAGADGRTVDALVAQGIDGIVVAGTGNGTIHHSLEASLLRAQDQGVAIVVSTRCVEGRVLALQKRLFADSAGLNPVKARIALILKLLDK